MNSTGYMLGSSISNPGVIKMTKTEYFQLSRNTTISRDGLSKTLEVKSGKDDQTLTDKNTN